jgi:hypothetical protein
MTKLSVLCGLLSNDVWVFKGGWKNKKYSDHTSFICFAYFFSISAYRSEFFSSKKATFSLVLKKYLVLYWAITDHILFSITINEKLNSFIHSKVLHNSESKLIRVFKDLCNYVLCAVWCATSSSSGPTTFNFFKKFLCAVVRNSNSMLLLQLLLSSTSHIDKAYPYSFLRPWLGSGLLTSTGKVIELHCVLLVKWSKMFCCRYWQLLLLTTASFWTSIFLQNCVSHRTLCCLSTNIFLALINRFFVYLSIILTQFVYMIIEGKLFKMVESKVEVFIHTS